MTGFIVLLVVLGVAVLAGLWWQGESKRRAEVRLADARAEAQRWYERLGGQLMNLQGDQPAVKQALADAAERYHAAGAQLERATTERQYRLAQETALEGLTYVRAARIALGLDPGPELPPLPSAQGAGRITKERAVEVDGQTYKAGPHPSDETPYYYPGGRVQGRPVPAGWYSQPIWKSALAGAAGAIGGMLIFDALFSPAFADPGYGFAAGYEQGFQDGLSHDAGADVQGAEADFAGGDFGGDFGDFGGDFGDVGGDFGGF